MSHPRIKLKLDELGRVYDPGETLSGEYCLDGLTTQEVRAVELSVLWHTQGKGDEDLSVHYFQRIEPSHGEVFDFREPRRFSTTLPSSPLSYHGLIVKICWRVRVRVFLARGKQLSFETPFELGHVPRAHAVTL
jgi:hypothetical protein